MRPVFVSFPVNFGRIKQTYFIPGFHAVITIVTVIFKDNLMFPQVGNAVPPPLALAIGHSLISVLQK
jgi:site-specific DNA-cytosine methylase